MIVYLKGLSRKNKTIMNFLKRLMTLLMYRKVTKLDELYQRHAGEECYIFGNGISLKWMDLNKFKDKPSILGSMGVYHKDLSSLDVTYCAIIEPYWFWPIFPDGGFKKFKFLRHTVHNEYRKTMLDHPEILFFLNISNFPVIRHLNTLWVSKWYCPPFETKNPFKERADAHDGTFKYQISLAIYLGFKKAYLVGHDYTHSPSRIHHFYEKGQGIIDEKKDFNKEFIQYAKQYIDLVTVTVDSESKAMDFIKYKDLTGIDPVFRENIEIVNMDKLKSLETWHDYTIF